MSRWLTRYRIERHWPVIVVASVSIAGLLIGFVSSRRLNPTLTMDPCRLPASREATARATWRTIEDLPHPILQCDTVFWEPRDTESLRERIRNGGFVRGKAVLEIGTGTGIFQQK